MGPRTGGGYPCPWGGLPGSLPRACSHSARPLPVKKLFVPAQPLLPGVTGTRARRGSHPSPTARGAPAGHHANVLKGNAAGSACPVERTQSTRENMGGNQAVPTRALVPQFSFPKGYHGTVFYCSFPGSFLQTSASVWARARLVCPPGRAGPLFELSRRGPSLWGRASERRFSDRRELGFLVACARWPGPGPASRAGQDPPAALVFLALRPCLVTTGTQATWATTEGAGWGNCKKAEGHHAECSSASFPPGVRRRAAVKALSTCRGL